MIPFFLPVHPWDEEGNRRERERGGLVIAVAVAAIVLGLGLGLGGTVGVEEAAAAHSDLLLEAKLLHECSLRAAWPAEDLSTVPAMVAAVKGGEGVVAFGAAGGAGVVVPLSLLLAFLEFFGFEFLCGGGDQQDVGLHVLQHPLRVPPRDPSLWQRLLSHHRL
eukprot:CAMPEP_0184344856 /NCGR_PEP_ID=MMETSP1089-20130417/13326_1 /TAXON_ID=38269 ORGANISM="Gloeochaete wittrockiana, Strain SAG46.84" /NCGR_SAMPLE_ID=MMETSP1089 /ASSEMBLY_ACC=CAM_ASM_000445 /LENGTH=162 /DNA_ID=CAMNT_0026674903 /DNA_START=145 /DNA_END=630 /DNA_ORIENTATION=-